MAYNAGSQSGNLVLLSSQVASGSSALTFTSVITTKYDDYVLRFNGVTGAGGANVLGIRYSVDNGSNYLSGANYTITGYFADTGSQSFFGAVAQTRVQIIGGLGASPDQSVGIVNLFNITSGTFKPAAYSQFMSTSNGRIDVDAAVYTSAIAVNAIQVAPDAGTFSGTFKLYGVQN